MGLDLCIRHRAPPEEICCHFGLSDDVLTNLHPPHRVHACSSIVGCGWGRTGVRPEFYINTQPQDWDSDDDGLPDGWEWKYGLDPLSPNDLNGSTGDPDGDLLTNLNEYLWGIPAGWDDVSTPTVLDNGVWWNGTVPVSNWDEESAMQIIQGNGSDGADEDPVGTYARMVSMTITTDWSIQQTLILMGTQIAPRTMTMETA